MNNAYVELRLIIEPMIVPSNFTCSNKIGAQVIGQQMPESCMCAFRLYLENSTSFVPYIHLGM